MDQHSGLPEAVQELDAWRRLIIDKIHVVVECFRCVCNINGITFGANMENLHIHKIRTEARKVSPLHI